jgi:hypothetical protein
MDLAEFVAESLVQIAKGVAAANLALKSESDMLLQRQHFVIPMGEQKDRNGGRIEFDVAVTTKVEGNGKSGAKFKLAIIEAELGGSGGGSREQVSRIKFSVATDRVIL